jgi:hypothetical protein
MVSEFAVIAAQCAAQSKMETSVNHDSQLSSEARARQSLAFAAGSGRAEGRHG